MLIAEKLYKDYKIKSGKFLRKKYEVKQAVRGISLKIEKGKVTGLLGINGAGKTTTIKMLTTMISPTSGMIKIDDIDAVKDYMLAKRKINLITGGERNIYWRLTARENLEYFGMLYGIGKRELANRIEEILRIVDLQEYENLPVEKYSKGMKQRLQIARGIINRPEYLFMDEPTLGLDIMITRSIHSYIRKLATEENKGILMTTHYIYEAEELCDYIYVIDKGYIVAQGTPEEIKSLYTHKNIYRFYVENLNCNINKLISRMTSNGLEISINKNDFYIEIKSSNQDVKSIFSELICQNVKVINIEIRKSSLEDSLFEILNNARNDIQYK